MAKSSGKLILAILIIILISAPIACMAYKKPNEKVKQKNNIDDIELLVFKNGTEIGDSPEGSLSEPDTYEAASDLIKSVIFQKCVIYIGPNESAHIRCQSFFQDPDYRGLLEDPKSMQFNQKELTRIVAENFTTQEINEAINRVQQEKAKLYKMIQNSAK